MEQGKLQVYYGNGQGKSSAALGNAIRAAGNGKRVYIVQFMKEQNNIDLIARLEPEVKVFRFERCVECFQDLSDEQKEEEKQNIINGLNFAKKALVTEECDLLVLDEILGVVEEGMTTEEELLNVLKARSLFTSVILTGTNLPESIKDFADEVMNIVSEKP
ncbi:MAG: cob(I)yrinic acid a,c-diamide adenosyltransferase [Lachnospiraceae bacterium]|nr:cob(I)yrinic acid a,c-diamide adenosyltransferase [Lachnospiraceae bacterium]MBQ1900986.1 cob(I)yrinic acid a,c-diamide adenosyltransferase [Lachnospiraceae bacterium]